MTANGTEPYRWHIARRSYVQVRLRRPWRFHVRGQMTISLAFLSPTSDARPALPAPVSAWLNPRSARIVLWVVSAHVICILVLAAIFRDLPNIDLASRNRFHTLKRTNKARPERASAPIPARPVPPGGNFQPRSPCGLHAKATCDQPRLEPAPAAVEAAAKYQNDEYNNNDEKRGVIHV